MIKKLRAKLRSIKKTRYLVLSIVTVGVLWYVHDKRQPLTRVGCGILHAERYLPPPLFYPLRWAIAFWPRAGEVEPIFQALRLPISGAEHELGVAGALICNGVDLTTRNSEGDTPLLVLVKRLVDGDEHYPALIAAILRHPIDVNEIDSNGDTALHLSVRGGHAGVMKKLMKRGADPRRTNSSGDTPLHLALRQPLSLWVDSRQIQLKKIELLLSNAMGREAVSMRDRAGRPALHLVSLIARTDVALAVLELLLKTDPDLRVTDLDGNDPEQFARLQQMPKVAERLAEFRALKGEKPPLGKGEIKH